MPINQSLAAVLRRRVRTLHTEGRDPAFLTVFMRAADELEIRTRCATDDEQVAIEAIANNRRLRHHFEEIVGLVEELPLPVRTKVAFQLRVQQILESQQAAGDGRGILAVALPLHAPREMVEARVRELLDNYWTAVDAAAAAGTPLETAEGLLVDTDVVDPPAEPTLSVDAMRAQHDMPALSPAAEPPLDSRALGDEALRRP